jgi:hypothetical protein
VKVNNPLQRAGWAGVAVLAVFVLIMWVGGVLLRWGSCAWYGYQTDRETRYAAFVGCMVQVENRWVPRNELRLVQ